MFIVSPTRPPLKRMIGRQGRGWQPYGMEGRFLSDLQSVGVGASGSQQELALPAPMGQWVRANCYLSFHRRGPAQSARVTSERYLSYKEK